LCAREGETASDDLSAGDDLPVPIAGVTIPGDFVRKSAHQRVNFESVAVAGEL
jgi:hypothetical protein